MAMPELVGMKLKEAIKIAEQRGYVVVCLKKGEKIDKKEIDSQADYIALWHDKNIVTKWGDG